MDKSIVSPFFLTHGVYYALQAHRQTGDLVSGRNWLGRTTQSRGNYRHTYKLTTDPNLVSVTLILLLYLDFLIHPELHPAPT